MKVSTLSPSSSSSLGNNIGLTTVFLLSCRRKYLIFSGSTLLSNEGACVVKTTCARSFSDISSHSLTILPKYWGEI